MCLRSGLRNGAKALMLGDPPYAVPLASSLPLPTPLNSIAFGKSTSQRIYPEQHTPKIGWKLHKYGLKHPLHTLADHFR